MFEKTLLPLSLLLAFASASYLLADTPPILRHCLGPGCPSVSVPLPSFENVNDTVVKNISTVSCDPDNDSTIADLNNCKNFYTCSNGTAFKLTCTLGYAFHPKLELCVPETLVKTCGKVYCPPSIILGLVPDPKNCTRYYRCIYGIPMHFQCDEATTFDEEIGKCQEYTEGNVPQCVNEGRGGESPISNATGLSGVDSSSNSPEFSTTDEISTTSIPSSDEEE